MKKYNQKFNSKLSKSLWGFVGIFILIISIFINIFNWPLGINGLDYSINIFWKILGISILILLGGTCILISFNIKYSISLFTTSLVILYISNFFHPSYNFDDFSTILPSYAIGIIIIFLLIRWEIKRLKK